MDKQVKEIMCIAQEECAEVVQAISKVFRFGFDSEWNGETNKEHLEEELGDVLAMIDILIEHNIVDYDTVQQAKRAKLVKLSKWSNIELSIDK